MSINVVYHIICTGYIIKQQLLKFSSDSYIVYRYSIMQTLKLPFTVFYNNLKQVQVSCMLQGDIYLNI